MKQINKILTVMVSIFALSACTQYTPSMMNTSSVQLSHSTMIEQVPLQDVSEGLLFSLSEHYRKNSTGPLDLTMTYDPTSKDFTAMKAVHKLKEIKSLLNKNGVINIKTQTMAVPKGMASLMVSYDIVQALAPNDCALMPGLEKDNTTRFLGAYKFGCSTETMIAKQIAHPADLQGNGQLGQREGRRSATVLEGYNRGEPRAPLEGLERDNLSTD